MINRIIIFSIIFMMFLFINTARATKSVLTSLSNLPGSTSTSYIGVMGNRLNAGVEGDETGAYNIIPSTGTFTAMYCSTNIPVTAGGIGVTLRTGTPASIPGPIPALSGTALTCIIADQDCYVVANVAVTAGDMASLEFISIGTTGGGETSCSLVFDSTTANRSILTGKTGGDDETGLTRWAALAGYTLNVVSNNEDLATKMPFAGTVTRICVAHEADPGANPNLRTFTLEVDGTNSALAVALAGTENLNCTAGAITFGAGSLLSVENNPASNPAVGTYTQAIEVESTTSGLFGFYFSSADQPSTASSEYAVLSGGSVWDNDELDVTNVLAAGVEFKDMYCDISAQVGTAAAEVADSYTIDLRGGDSGALADVSGIDCAFTSGSGTGDSDTLNTVRLNGGKFISLEMTPVSSPATKDFRVGISASVIRRFLQN